MKSNGKTRLQTKRNSAAAKTRRKRRVVARATGTAVTLIRHLSASNLKDALWETLTDLRTENILPNRADAIAAQAREILRTVKVQLQVAGQAKRQVPDEIIRFSENSIT